LTTNQSEKRVVVDEVNVKYWEIIADRLSKSGWSWGCVAVVNYEMREVFVVDAHRSDSRSRFIVRSDDLLTAFWELKGAVSRM
jgi:hypothetical protein